MSPRGRIGPALWAMIALNYSLVLGPILVVVVAAFSPTDFFVFPPPGLSLRWFRAFFELDNMRGAFLLSIQVACLAASIATVLGTFAAIHVGRRRGAGAGLLQSVFMAPLVFPTIILGLALLLVFRTVGIPVLPGIVLAHIVVGLPYCFRSVLTSFQSFDPALEEAAQSLRASPLQTFLRVTLPLIRPGVLTGWLFAFIVSFGELNTSLFLTGPGYVTLPIEIFSYLQFEGGQLVVAAASTVQVALIVVLVLAVERLVGLGRVVRG
ncbi:MAG: ABC transporter permease [Proteobacteria bacterium]|nr:ABC transporter permease [Pseudomonadota bacterium]